jgi:hypothetical protein
VKITENRWKIITTGALKKERAVILQTIKPTSKNPRNQKAPTTGRGRPQKEVFPRTGSINRAETRVIAKDDIRGLPSWTARRSRALLRLKQKADPRAKKMGFLSDIAPFLPGLITRRTELPEVRRRHRAREPSMGSRVRRGEVRMRNRGARDRIGLTRERSPSLRAHILSHSAPRSVRLLVRT